MDTFHIEREFKNFCLINFTPFIEEVTFEKICIIHFLSITNMEIDDRQEPKFMQAKVI